MAKIESAYRYTYVVTGDAWYATRLPNADEMRREVTIQRHAVNDHGYSDGVAWEFDALQRDLGGPTLEVRMFHDAWDAFDDIPELFTALRERSPRTLDDLRVMLDEIGLIDVTERRKADRVRMDLFSESLPHRAVCGVSEEETGG